MANRVSFSFSPPTIQPKHVNSKVNNDWDSNIDDLEDEFSFDFNKYYEEEAKLNEIRENEFNYKITINQFENQQREFEGNYDSLSNSISLFSIQQKSKLKEIKRVTEEFEFELSQLNRQLDKIHIRKNQIQAEFNAIENSKDIISNSINLIKQSSYNTMALNSQVFAENNLIESITNYTQKNRELSKDIEKLNGNLNALNFQSGKILQKIDHYSAKKRQLLQKIKSFRNIRFQKQNSLIEQIADSISILKAHILKQKIKTNSLRVTEQLLLQKLLSLNEKELILNQETKLLNNLSQKIIQLKENIKLTKSVQTEIDKPLNLVYEEIYDNIQKELQNEINLKQKLDDLHEKNVFYNFDNIQKSYLNKDTLHQYERKLNNIENELIEIKEEIIQKKNEKIAFLNEMKYVKYQTKRLIMKNNQLSSHRNGEIDGLLNTMCQNTTVKDLKELKMKITQKQKEIDEKKQQLADRNAHLDFILKHYMPD